MISDHIYVPDRPGNYHPASGLPGAPRGSRRRTRVAANATVPGDGAVEGGRQTVMLTSPCSYRYACQFSGKFMMKNWSVGSTWQRWDPHLHAPGTLRNDGFHGDWDGYIRRIEQAQPAPVALGVTDYFTLRGYKEVFRRRQQGALPNIPLVFANVEIRLTLETKNRQGINLHFLVSPEDPNHVALMEEKLGLLLFTYNSENYPCTDDGLRRLGRAHKRNPNLPDEAALGEGAGQFKVELGEVRKLFNNDQWFRTHVLVAVAAGTDGLSGVAQDAQFHAQRQELGRFADVVFSATPSDRAYWLGEHPNFEADGQSPKPCLQGSDAHSLDTVLRPFTSPQEAGNEPRICWIRAESTFDGLRQTLVEPKRRVHIGGRPPDGPSPSDTIRVLRVRNAPWLQTTDIPLNQGLVTVIGARGSGKTALADLLALAADADEEDAGNASFLEKARSLLGGLEAEVEWGDGTTTVTEFPRNDYRFGPPRVRYLSQKFVEALCSSAEHVDTDRPEPLNEEIEHVVFNAIAEEDRLMCATLSELRALRLQHCLAREDDEREEIRNKTVLIGEKNSLRKALELLKGKTAEAERVRKGLEAELARIPIKADDAIAKQYAAASERLAALKAAIAGEQRGQQLLKDLSSEVDRQKRAGDAVWQGMKDKYSTLLSLDEWELLRLRMDDKAIETLQRAERVLASRVAALRERGALPVTGGPAPAASPTVGLKALDDECQRLAKALGLDQANANRRVELERQLAAAKQTEAKARALQASAEAAGPLLEKLRAERSESYERVFEALDAQRDTLNDLYEPLRTRLTAEPRLSKLTFVVERVVDLDAWVERGERLFDLRRPPFGGKGALAEHARKTLLTAWRTGAPSTARVAMDGFTNLIAQATLAQNVTFIDVGEWLFSTGHIAIRYAIRFEGLELSQLSPGTRGVVLLTLYLGLDHWDRRPLIIDQPEENLDPRSVFDILVPFFRDAAHRRQIIMVTHNANLVVNTDSDQVIVAQSERVQAGALPNVTYFAGGLEDSGMRQQVCALLEGGEEAFERRRKRYAPRLRLQ